MEAETDRLSNGNLFGVSVFGLLGVINVLIFGCVCTAETKR